MAKLIPAIALISVLLLIIASASAYRTIITTVEIDEKNPRGQSCRQEFERQDLSDCENYVRQSNRGSSKEVLAMRGGENQQQQRLKQCCNQIQRVRDDCQCDVLKYIVEEQTRGGQTEREEYRRAMQRASNIPSACGLSQSCDFRAAFF